MLSIVLLCPSLAAAAEAIPIEDVGEPTIKVLDPSMAELEGPAIFVTSL